MLRGFSAFPCCLEFYEYQIVLRFENYRILESKLQTTENYFLVKNVVLVLMSTGAACLSSSCMFLVSVVMTLATW